MGDVSKEAFPALGDAQFMALVTYRRSGAEVVTPVWFAQQGDTLYLSTGRDSGKVKRTRNDGRVRVAQCDRAGNVEGPWAEGYAVVLGEGESGLAEELLNAKYGAARTAMLAMRSAGPGESAYMAVRPAPLAQAVGGVILG